MARNRIISLVSLVMPIAIAPGLFAGTVEERTNVRSRRITTTEEESISYNSGSARLIRDRVTEALDRIRDKIEQWGVVTISAPIAILNETAFYVPDNIVLPQDAYKSAQTDIQASAVQAMEVTAGNQLGTTVIPAIPTPPPGGASTQSTNSTTTVTSPPNPNDQELPPLPTPGGTIAPLNLGGTSNPTKSVAAALREAQDNTMRQHIYTQMSYPKEIADYNHVVFAIVQVSCNPGWRTKEHYIADCSASLEYFDQRANEQLSRGARRAPTVFSVLPLIDAQTIEMANSQREVTQLAFQLAASLPAHGVNIRAKDLFQFVRRYSRDLRSRTPIPVVNSYSSGGTFGFRFSPSFQAMSDPAQKNARAANVLLPTSFPALITVVVNQSDLDYIARTYPESSPAILTHVSTRWALKDRPPLWQLPKRLFTPMRRDTAEMEINAAEDVKKVYDAKAEFKRLSDSETFNPMYQEMRREIIALEEKGIGRDWPIPLSPLIFSETIKAEQKTKDDLMRKNYEDGQKKKEG